MSRAGHPRGFCPHGIDIDSACADCLKVTGQSNFASIDASDASGAPTESRPVGGGSSPPSWPAQFERTLTSGKVVKIRTSRPNPYDSNEWYAWDDNYDGPGSPQGWGKTEENAVADLIEQLEERAS